MQTQLPAEFLATPEGSEADRILRNCVHCGFCNATCPTYQLLGDELDGPRGRIYLMKQMFEDGVASGHTRLHLDRCLTCRNCETTCPSGVEYGHLIDIGREWVETHVPRSLPDRLRREGLRRVLLAPGLFGGLLKLGRGVRAFLPASLKRRVPEARPAMTRPVSTHSRRMLLLEGCVQPDIDPGINAAAVRVLDRLGIALTAAPNAGCCGALSQHLGAVEAAREAMRRNIDSWWPAIEAGVEAIVMTASGCGSQVKDYGYLLRDDPAYAHKAACVSGLTRDLAEVLAGENLAVLEPGPARRIAFHPPCSLQHGQKVRGVIEGLLTKLGHELLPVDEAHLCCGSAGTYSILQPEIAGQLRDRKLSKLQARGPELIATANIGCQTHLAAASGVPVVHWITLLEPQA
ncbi:MAG: glycolate oxidase subunit GlcF [Parasulfuritortus sp.]|jgi:glycolate oxidase iron-sulfur subunit|nr:glycolate oxidase subunit GlcF [Parasulfuritortus sp.]